MVGTNGSAESFITSAPGKVIVFGEHAVVHGKAAIAAAISLRSYLLVNPQADGERNVTLKFPDVSLDHAWALDSLPWAAFSHAAKAKHHTERVSSLDPELVEALKAHVDLVSPNAEEHVQRVHRHAASAFLYVLLSLATPEIAPCTYILRSNIPIAAGLGSSASISVCISAAVLHQMRRLELPSPTQSRAEAEAAQEIINRWAFVGELCIHGNPSGVDNTVATRGKAVLFKRQAAGQPPLVTPLHEFPVLPLLLADTKQSRSTAVEVAKVGALKTAHPVVADTLLDAIDKVAESALDLLKADFASQPHEALIRLGELIRINHGLLVSLGVSHPKLERIREIVDHSGIGWTKLTGAGGGGCSITLLKEEMSVDTLRTLEARLEAEGFAKYETLLGGPGVGILTPAKLQGSAESINPEAFLQAKTSDEIEQLVGPGTNADSRGWKYWT